MEAILDLAREQRITAYPLKFTRNINGKRNLVTGYAAVFNRSSIKIGWFKEKIAPGAFEGTDMSDVLCLLNHDQNIIYARKFGTCNTLKLFTDVTGLKYEFESPNTQEGRNLQVNIGLINIMHSGIIFTSEKDEWTRLKGDKDGALELRTITKIKKLFTVSIVTLPTNYDTSITQLKRFYGKKTFPELEKARERMEQKRIMYNNQKF